MVPEAGLPLELFNITTIILLKHIENIRDSLNANL